MKINMKNENGTVRIQIRASYSGIIGITGRWWATVCNPILALIGGAFLNHLLLVEDISVVNCLTALIVTIITVMLMLKAKRNQMRHRLNYQLEILKVLTEINVEIRERLSDEGSQQDYLNLYEQNLVCAVISCDLINEYGRIMDLSDTRKMHESLIQCGDIISKISPHLDNELVEFNSVMLESREELMALINTLENEERNN